MTTNHDQVSSSSPPPLQQLWWIFANIAVPTSTQNQGGIKILKSLIGSKPNIGMCKFIINGMLIEWIIFFTRWWTPPSVFNFSKVFSLLYCIHLPTILPHPPIPAGQGAGCARALQTSALFGQSAGQTKSKRDTSQKQWMRILTRYKVFSCAPHRLRPQIMLCLPHSAHPVN